jgi:hypothetical protein
MLGNSEKVPQNWFVQTQSRIFMDRGCINYLILEECRLLGCYAVWLLFIADQFLSPWWWRHYVPPKRRFLQQPHCITSQITAFLTIVEVRNNVLATVTDLVCGRAMCSFANSTSFDKSSLLGYNAPSLLRVNSRFGETCLHFQGQRMTQARKQRESRRQAEHYSGPLKMEVICSSEMTVDFLPITRSYSCPGRRKSS